MLKPSSFDLSGQTALVTGASRGLGMAIAHGLAQAGADIVAVSANQRAQGSEIQGLVENAGRRFAGRACNFAERAQTYELVDWLDSEGHDIDILVNNAGTIRRAPAAEHSDDDWDAVLEINLTVPFLLARQLGASMLERGQGKVIFVSSILGFQGGVTVPGYASTKSAVLGLTKALANEWAEQGVNVNAIAPGYMRTDNTQVLQADAVRSEAIRDRIPAGDWGTPDDIAGTAVFLASPASDYIHGSVITVDGGWMGR
jgi:2-dehydro-3-deoxy-D-gluconate 5-dehydrogenase